MDVRMTLKPAIIPWLVGIEIAQNNINLPFVAVGSNDPIHEIQKLRAAASFLMAASIAHKSEGFLSFEQCTG
jgi:NADH:ubiquinone oxidoreductase subunit K